MLTTPSVSKRCRSCSQSFEVSSFDQAFYRQMELPLPTLCPPDRRQRRSAFRNERNLYRRTCDGTEESIISVFPPSYRGPVYGQDYWWSEKWNANDYARDVDFTRPFFEQFFELYADVPRCGVLVTHCENCDYSPYTVYSRNCYMAFSCVESEDVHYSYQTNFSRDCMDCTFCRECELCYECTYCVNCYDVRYSIYAENCSNSWFLKNCIGCSNCFACVNLRNKEYCFYNEYLGKERYEEAIGKLNLQLRASIDAEHQKFLKWSKSAPHRYVFATQNENVTGDNIHRSKNCHDCYDTTDLEDCAYVYTLPGGAKDCFDVQFSPRTELVCEALSAVASYNSKFLLLSWDMKDSAYCSECFYSSNLFGCTGLRNAQYSILNKEYSQDDYMRLKDKLVEHMKSTGEWGEFFSMKYSPFAYNQSLAQETSPKTRVEVEELGLRWEEEDDPIIGEGFSLPGSAEEVRDDLMDKVYCCKESGRRFKLIHSEVMFYQKMDLPPSPYHSDVRHAHRMKRKNPQELFPRVCSQCEIKLKSSFSPERPELVYCEQCFQEAVE